MSESKEVAKLACNVPTLEEYEVASVDMVAEYWTPQNDGEVRRMVFWECGKYRCLDQNDGNEIEIDVVFFVQSVNGVNKKIAQGSKRLLGIFEGGNVEQGTPVQVTFLGMRKNATNNNQGAAWSVVELKPKSSKEEA